MMPSSPSSRRLSIGCDVYIDTNPASDLGPGPLQQVRQGRENRRGVDRQFAVTWTSAELLAIRTGALTALVRRIDMLMPSGAACVWGGDLCAWDICTHRPCDVFSLKLHITTTVAVPVPYN